MTTPNPCDKPNCAICAWLTDAELEAASRRLPEPRRGGIPLPPPGQPARPEEGWEVADVLEYLRARVASLEAERDALKKSDVGYWMALAEERRIEIAELRRKATETIRPFRGGDTNDVEKL